MPTDQVNHPNHYGGDTVYEVIKVLEAWKIDNARLFQTIKYIARAGKKNKATYLEDLKKARFYLDREIALTEGAVFHYEPPPSDAKSN